MALNQGKAIVPLGPVLADIDGCNRLSTPAGLKVGVLSSVPEWLRGIEFFVPPLVNEVNRFRLSQRASTGNVLLRRGVLETTMPVDAIFRPEFALVGGGARRVA